MSVLVEEREREKERGGEEGQKRGQEERLLQCLAAH